MVVVLLTFLAASKTTTKKGLHMCLARQRGFLHVRSNGAAAAIDIIGIFNTKPNKKIMDGTEVAAEYKWKHLYLSESTSMM